MDRMNDQLSSSWLFPEESIPTEPGDNLLDVPATIEPFRLEEFGLSTSTPEAQERKPAMNQDMKDRARQSPCEDCNLSMPLPLLAAPPQTSEVCSPDALENERSLRTQPIAHATQRNRGNSTSETTYVPTDREHRRQTTTIAMQEFETDLSPVEPGQDAYHRMLAESIAPEVEYMLRQDVERSSQRSMTLAVPKETYQSECLGECDDAADFDAIIWNTEQYEGDTWYGSVTAQNEALKTTQDHGELVIVGAGVQILEDSSGNSYGVPVTKASVDATRRDSGIRFTLTCVEDGYEDAEVLFDDDFLYEEEIMDPDYFRKKESGSDKAPTPRPALLRISSY